MTPRDTGRALATEIRKAARRCRGVQGELERTWNRISSLRSELTHHRLDADRRTALETRLRERMGEQDRLEVEMTKAAERWAALTARAEEAAARAARARAADTRQPVLFGAA
jgi:predicted RNase H-like nuclease (RuvC/YqgF family)